MSQQSESQDQSFQVQLAIYDLSHGMASTLSLSLLGPDHSIPIVPHTGILIYGREYYFGGNGIESSDPHHFRSTRGLNPLEVKHLGTTNVSRSQFEDWCRSHRIGGSNGLYSPTSYDLFSRNCNNFSQHAVKEGLLLEGNDSHVPQWILDVPNRVLASPMGQMIRPMMEQMQVRGPSGDGANSMSFSEKTEKKREVGDLDEKKIGSEIKGEIGKAEPSKSAVKKSKNLEENVNLDGPVTKKANNMDGSVVVTSGISGDAKKAKNLDVNADVNVISCEPVAKKRRKDKVRKYQDENEDEKKSSLD